MAFRGRGGRFAPTPVIPSNSRLRDESLGGFMMDGLTPGIGLYAVALSANINRVMYEVAQEMEAWAKANHVWQNRTTDAETGLTVVVNESPTTPEIVIYHTVSYGVWLEIRWNGKYAIIMPTIERFGPILMARLRGAI